MSVTGAVTYRHTYNSNDLAELIGRFLSFDEILDLKKMSSEARLNAWEKKTGSSGVGLSRVSTPQVTEEIKTIAAKWVKRVTDEDSVEKLSEENHQLDQPKILEEFTLFPNLAKEPQLKIWGYAVTPWAKEGGLQTYLNSKVIGSILFTSRQAYAAIIEIIEVPNAETLNAFRFLTKRHSIYPQIRPYQITDADATVALYLEVTNKFWDLKKNGTLIWERENDPAHSERTRRLMLPQNEENEFSVGSILGEDFDA